MKKNELEQIKEMFFEEGLPVPVNLQERLENFPRLLDANLKEIKASNIREKFLIIATNTLLGNRFKTIQETDTYFRLNEELKELWFNNK